jgi:hypothetical protein
MRNTLPLSSRKIASDQPFSVNPGYKHILPFTKMIVPLM